MKQVLKYRLSTGYQTIFTVNMPINARILDVQLQDDVPVMWAIVDPEDVPVPRDFYVSWTATNLPNLFLVYLGSIQGADGLVSHYFEVA